MSEIVKKLAGLAKEAVDSYVQESLPLEEGIAKIASREDLNHDEVKRLVEASNTLTWLSTVKPQMDKTAEFSVASFPGVLEKLAEPVASPELYDVDGASFIIEEDSLHKCAEEVIQVVDVESLKENPFEAMTSFEKTASLEEGRGYLGKSAALKENALERSEFDLRCLMEETKEALATTIEKVARRCSSIYADPFCELEKKAYASFKDTSIKPLLDLVYQEATFQKTASDRVSAPMEYAYGDSHVYDSSQELELVKEAYDYMRGMLTLRRALTEKTAEHEELKNKYASTLRGA